MPIKRLTYETFRVMYLSKGGSLMRNVASGKPLELVPKRMVRKFCCKECKIQWWNLNRDKVKKTTKIEVVCQNCGETFKVYEWERGGIVGWIVIMRLVKMCK
ncbi:hypothetical protein BBG06_04740 [Streptococcus dysgalactiae subsp. equisimilis]|uniref:Zinc-finger protein n=1 Tax=Streptococcus dysgalactiae subsp. equisimilis TaxID=119602 RepID=A0A9X8XHC2_STREQ|nr:hypothetical protein [Streptococcus dysgalactiae]OBZ01490.1 hypothetical protein BBG06_04740 [Streptococcus dysgalactiae subsp. equisimilis]SUN62503.1 Zinc-finger protein [Streptococcus dysgalactiae subsp. equisimilis]